MEATFVSTGFKSEITPYGKINGILDNLQQLAALTNAFTELGVQEIEVLDGQSGEVLLEKEHGSMFKYFLGDMEPKILQSYLHAVENKMLVFAAHVGSDNADQVAAVAKAHGAKEVVHFGNWVITNY